MARASARRLISPTIFRSPICIVIASTRPGPDDRGMGLRMSAVFTDLRNELRFEPVRQQIRASYDGQVVVETTDAALVWEPHAKIPAYAVPTSSIRVPMA